MRILFHSLLILLLGSTFVVAPVQAKVMRKQLTKLIGLCLSQLATYDDFRWHTFARNRTEISQ